jgi:hypothetical protein
MNKNKRWATFTYISPQKSKVTNTIRNTNGNNTIANNNKAKDNKIPPNNKWGIYKLTCSNYSRSYLG